MNEWELPLIGGAGDALTSLLPSDSPEEVMVNAMNPLAMVSGPASRILGTGTRRAINALNTSTRVKGAREALENAGVDTMMARNVVPRRGTDAEQFMRGVQSINPAQSKLQPGTYPSIEEIIGPGYQDLGRMELGGISPKRVLRSASGDKYLHKGTAYQPGAGLNMEQRPDVIALADTGEVAREDSVSKLANLLSAGNKTPWAQGVQEGGSLQKLLHNTTNLRDLNQAGMAPLRNPNMVKQLQDEQIVDSLLRVSDRHPGQFVLSPDDSMLYSIDKGLGGFEGYMSSPFFTPSQGMVYETMERGRPLSQFVDPKNYQEAIQRMKQVPEQSMRSAMNPLWNDMGLADQTREGFLRNFMQARELLPRAFDEYYRRMIQP